VEYERFAKDVCVDTLNTGTDEKGSFTTRAIDQIMFTVCFSHLLILSLILVKCLIMCVSNMFRITKRVTVSSDSSK